MGVGEIFLNDTWGKRKENFQGLEYSIIKGRGMEQYEICFHFSGTLCIKEGVVNEAVFLWSSRTSLSSAMRTRRCYPPQFLRSSSKHIVSSASHFSCILHISSSSLLRRRKDRSMKAGRISWLPLKLLLACEVHQVYLYSFSWGSLPHACMCESCSSDDQSSYSIWYGTGTDPSEWIHWDQVLVAPCCARVITVVADVGEISGNPEERLS